jgi:hypothetical protein
MRQSATTAAAYRRLVATDRVGLIRNNRIVIITGGMAALSCALPIGQGQLAQHLGHRQHA